MEMKEKGKRDTKPLTGNIWCILAFYFKRCLGCLLFLAKHYSIYSQMFFSPHKKLYPTGTPHRTQATKSQKKHISFLYF